MRVARSLAELATLQSSSAVTIGNFDGVHCGHRMVIAALLDRARALSATATEPVSRSQSPSTPILRICCTPGPACP